MTRFFITTLAAAALFWGGAFYLAGLWGVLGLVAMGMALVWFFAEMGRE